MTRDAPAARRRAGARPPSSTPHELGDDVRALLADDLRRARRRDWRCASRRPEPARRLVPELPYLGAEVLFAVRHEHAAQVEDVLRRRVPLFRDARSGAGGG